MPEYKFVTLPTEGKQVRSSGVDAYASAELNEVYVSQGWEVVDVTRTTTVGPIGFLLKRG